MLKKKATNLRSANNMHSSLHSALERCKNKKLSNQNNTSFLDFPTPVKREELDMALKDACAEKSKMIMNTRYFQFVNNWDMKDLLTKECPSSPIIDLVFRVFNKREK